MPQTTADTAIHQEADFEAKPQRVYEALLDEKQFAAATGAPAQIDPVAGGAFSLFGGRVTGRTLELVPNPAVAGWRLVQAWRIGAWPAGVYSTVRFELGTEGTGTKLVFDQTGFPPEDRDELNLNWPRMYWEPIRKHLSA